MKLLQYTYILLSMFAVVVVIQLVKISGTSDTLTPIPALEKTIVSTDTSLNKIASVPYFNKSENSWSLPARVLEIKDVSIYGRSGSIARMEYVHGGDARVGWAVLRIDDYSFTDSSREITVGDRLTLRVTGDYVSSKGVDWSACPKSDEFCQHASFIEGGFPTSKDYGGLTISPSNTLIHSGSINDDWINGMLAWRITLEN
ncbi:MAG TPA: hypothetical protein V6D48_06110 [Oculatellaceae cyanobacterium]